MKSLGHWNDSFFVMNFSMEVNSGLVNFENSYAATDTCLHLFGRVKFAAVDKSLVSYIAVYIKTNYYDYVLFVAYFIVRKVVA